MRLSIVLASVFTLGAIAAPITPAGNMPERAVEKRCNLPKCAKDTAYSIFKDKREPEPEPEPKLEPVHQPVVDKRCNLPKCAKDTAYSIYKE